MRRGPGRAGGGEELGGLHGLWFYHQRVAVQGAGPTYAALNEQADRSARVVHNEHDVETTSTTQPSIWLSVT